MAKVTKENVKTVTDMRKDPVKLLKEVGKGKDRHFVIFYRSKPEAVLLSLDEYNKIQGMLEDYFDSKEAQEFESKDKSEMDWVEHDDLMKT